MGTINLRLRGVVILGLFVGTTLAVTAQSSLWKRVPANPDGAAVTGKLQFKTDSQIVCAMQAAQRGSDLLCHDGVMACVIVLTTSLVGVLGVTNHAWNCFLRGPWCRPPFMQVRDLGCLQFGTGSYVDFSAARTACPPPATLWYPKSNVEAADMHDYLQNDRYAAPAGGVCGPSVPLPDGQPGPCSAANGTNTCCNATGFCGATTADCYCSTCANYKFLAQAFWVGFERINGIWTYDDNRTVSNARGEAPWGSWDPVNITNCAAMSNLRPPGQYYEHVELYCNGTVPVICAWPNAI